MSFLSEETESTSSSLLRRVQSHEPRAWQRLVTLFGPVIYGWCRGCGLQPSDAADVSQEVFRSVAANVAAFNRSESGSFRAWLWTITRNKVRDHLRRRRQHPQGIGGTSLQTQLLAVPEAEEPETAEPRPEGSQNQLIHAALELIRSELEDRTWTAFWRVAVEQHDVAQVATDLGLSAAAVRQAKYRVLRRLRTELGDFL